MTVWQSISVAVPPGFGSADCSVFGLWLEFSLGFAFMAVLEYSTPARAWPLKSYGVLGAGVLVGVLAYACFTSSAIQQGALANILKGSVGLLH